ncbi:MAG: tetratricopeptide repeat protein [Desulfobacterales bacterium]|nr:tetratricopeptide repeat protein [Desulfobacterales bacterium]
MGFLGKLFGKTPEALEARGDAFYAKKTWGKAKLDFEAALEKWENDRHCPSVRKERLRGKIRDAREALASEHRQNGEDLIEARCWEDARELLNLALELTEDETLASEVRELIRKAGDDEARDHADEMVEYDYFEPEEEEEGGDPYDPHDPHYQYQPHDEEYFTVLVDSLPEPMQEAYLGYGATFRRGYTALNRGDFETAAEELALAMEENSRDGYIPLELSTAWINLGRVEEARNLLEEFVNHHPDVLSAHEMLCEIYWGAGEFDRAGDLLSALPPFIAETTPAFSLWGENLVRAGKLAEAEEYYRENLEEFGWDEFIAANLAGVYEEMNEPGRARELYERIMAECAGCGARVSTDTKRRYADICFEAGDDRMTLLETYLSLTREDPENAADYYRKVSRIYGRLGAEEESRRFRWIADQRNQPGEEPND